MPGSELFGAEERKELNDVLDKHSERTSGRPVILNRRSGN
jgi:hypothetical protein